MTLSSLSLRPLAFGLVSLTAGFGASAAMACPDWTLTGTQISYSAQDLTQPQAIGVIAGGNIDVSNCPIPAHGYVITQPDFDFSFTDNSAGMDLTLRVEGACDTVLLVNDATGTWQFSDDEGDSLNPALVLPAAPAGAYDIWVGTFGQQTCEARLILSAAPANAAPPARHDAPANLTAYRNQVGQTLTFTVTGSTTGSVWGSGVYTDDSSLAAAAVHAGVLRAGESRPVEVTILPGQQSYAGSNQNGVQSSNYGTWQGSFTFPAAMTTPAAMADPGNLTRYRDRVGETLTFMVTGSTSGSVWGSGVYTDDSALAVAAVHAGVLQPGQSAPVEVTIMAGQQSYNGSAQNGVQSSNYGTWQGSYSFPAAAATTQAPGQAPAAGK